MAYPLAEGATHVIMTSPVAPSIDVVGADIVEGLDAATIDFTEEKSPSPHWFLALILNK